MPVTKPKYNKPMYAVDEVVILLVDGDTYAQAKILQANTTMEGNWIYRFNKDISAFPVSEDDIVGRAV